MLIIIDPQNLGWMQCTQCGNGFEVTKEEVEAGDYVDRQCCDECGIGPMKIDWTYPDGPGWKADNSNKQLSCNDCKLNDNCPGFNFCPYIKK